MGSDIVNQFIDEGKKIKEKQRESISKNAANRIIVATGDMPEDMNQWMSRIKIYASRHLLNHPLQSDIQSTIFHNKNNIRDYEKMMGLLQALSQDTELLDDISLDTTSTQHPPTATAPKIKLNKPPYNSETLLREIVASKNPVEMLCEEFSNSSAHEKEALQGLLGELSDKGYIKIQWASNLPYIVHIQNSTRVRYEQEAGHTKGRHEMQTQKPLVFISHCDEDVFYSDKLVELFQKMQVPDDCIFSYSSSGHKIPLGKDIYETLKEKLDYGQKVLVIFILSNEFYKSADCLNEMGAAWIASQERIAMLVPEFDFTQVKGVIGKNKIHMKVAERDRLNELKDRLTDFFALNSINQNSWEKMRDDYIAAASLPIPKSSVATSTKNSSNENESIQIEVYEGKDIRVKAVGHIFYRQGSTAPCDIANEFGITTDKLVSALDMLIGSVLSAMPDGNSHFPAAYYATDKTLNYLCNPY